MATHSARINIILTPPKAEALTAIEKRVRSTIAQDTRDYIAKGGVISVYPPNLSQYDYVEPIQPISFHRDGSLPGLGAPVIPLTA